MIIALSMLFGVLMLLMVELVAIAVYVDEWDLDATLNLVAGSAITAALLIVGYFIFR